MGDILYRQTLQITAAKNPTVTGAAITEKDFEISPADQLEITDMNENMGGRFSLAPAVVDQGIGMGTVALGKVLAIKPEANLTAKIVNAAGTSQELIFKAGRWSVLHLEFTNVLLSNPGATALKGKYFVAGD